MTAYMDLNGIPASGNRWLFTEVLREQWGFDGFVVSDANAVRNLVTHGFAADLADAGGARRRRRGRPRDGDDRPRVRPPARGGGERRGERGGRRRLRTAGAGGQAAARPVREPVRRRGPGPDGAGRPGAPRRWRGSPRSGRRCCCATRATCCRWTPAALGSVAVLGPLADSQRDTLGPWVLRLRPGRDRHRAGRAARAGWADSTEVRYAPGHPAGPADVPVDVRHVPGQHAARPRGLRRRGGAAAGGRPGPGQRPGRRGARRVAADDRRGRLALVAGAARPPARAAAGRRRPPARRWCCW